MGVKVEVPMLARVLKSSHAAVPKAVSTIELGVAVGVNVAVAVTVGLFVGVLVGVFVGVNVEVAVGVNVAVAVGVNVDVAVGVAVFVAVGVGVGSAAKFAVTEILVVTLVSVRGLAVEASLQLTKWKFRPGTAVTAEPLPL